MTTPDEIIAAAIVARAAGWVPAKVTRFPTGSAHYVFDAIAGDGARAVLRMGLVDQRDEMRAGLELQLALGEHGVPVPRILAADVDDSLPWVLMQRLDGTDLGHVLSGLSQPNSWPSRTKWRMPRQGPPLSPMPAASAMQRAHRRRRMPAGPGWCAPASSWTRQRITAAGLFDTSIADQLLELLARHETALDAIPATPFLHDTTTKNVIIAADGTFSGIVDVDDFCFGDPRWAPALTKAALIAHGHSDFYAHAWMDAAGHEDDVLFEFYVAVFLGDLMAEHGQVFNGNEVASTQEQRAYLQGAFDQALGGLG